MVSAGPVGARVVAVVPGLSWSAVRAGDGRGDQGDVGVVEAALGWVSLFRVQAGRCGPSVCLCRSAGLPGRRASDG